MKKNIFSKIKVAFLISLLTLTFFNFNLSSAKATVATVETVSIPQVLKNAWDKIEKAAEKWYKSFGAKLIGTTIRNTLNRVALSAASYVASAGMGQQPTFVVEEFSTYWKNIGDAAAGDFIDGLGEGWGVDLCQPPSADLQVKVGLGLVQTLEPKTPNCTLSQLSSNYASAWEKLAAMETGDFVKSVQVSFDPGVSELSGAFTLFGRTQEASTKATEEEKTKNTITEGWLDVRNIAGKAKTAPGTAEEKLKQAQEAQTQNLLTTTGDALVDAANTFLNQLAYEAFQKILQTVTQGAETSRPLDTNALANRVNSGFTSLIQYGESVVGEKMASVIKPRFDVRSDYSVLSELAVCPDQENPGPNNCVIDDKFSQAISEKMTVGDALKKGYLHGDWLVTSDSKAESAYTLRSASILRKYRIVPLGWEQAILTAASKNYQVTFQDLISCFDGKGVFSSGFDKNDIAWCQGLVDPNWVLKAPLNYCAKQGYGSQIMSSLLSQDENGFPILAISRADDYCADEKSCIKEKNDGSCELYGYCNEEKRTWKFNSETCEPVYNTCQSFTSVSDNKKVSYLENTLDFSTCDSNNSGCKQYSYLGVYSSSTNQVAWNKNASIFFNQKITDCDSSSEGCTELLRGKSGWTDVNYIMDSSFSANNIGDTSSITSNWAWPIRNGLGAIVYEDSKALFVKGWAFASLFSDNKNSVIPKNLEPINGWSYTLSAEIKINSASKVSMSFGSDGKTAEVSGVAYWQPISVTLDQTNNLNFAITGYNDDGNVEFFVRNLKLTPNSFNPGFSNYAAFPVYQKILPAYLESVCYEAADGAGNYSLKQGAPEICNNYARKCNRADVGCDSFSSVKDNFTVAAKANTSDYCDAQCVGYDTYLAKETYFYGTSADNLIPGNANECSAESVGCASFTNLDAVSSGGEQIEYYSKLRQCIKPDASTCADFYSWDNSQLKVMSLKVDANNNPFLVNPGLSENCTAEIYNLPASDPRYNPDCREFYSKNGKVTYNLLSNTVSCSENCYSYRLNEKNIDKSLNSNTCVGSDKKWDSAQSACYVCKNNGVWNNTQNACIYSAIPEEGTKCAAENVGCREYNGNNGNNLKLVASYTFDNSLDDFYSLKNGAELTLSSDSIYKNGQSLGFYDGAGVDVSSFAKEGSAYIIKFLAKASGPEVTANFSFENSKGEAATFNVTEDNPLGNVYIKNDSAWHVYEINLRELNHEINLDVLKIKTNNSVLIDNVIITEITDRYYLIKGSSYVPDVCFYDIFDKYQGPNYNLGCAQYQDASKITHNLHQFSSLCSDSAVGCEQMIQTHNYSGYYGLKMNLNSDDVSAACNPGDFGCVEVRGHEAVYAVFDPSKQCNKADAGCSRFGVPQTSGSITTWADVYKKNTPNTYANENSSPLCSYNEVGCDTWVTDNNSSLYFKNPGLNTCVFKNNFWYKSPVKRCDANASGGIDGSEKDAAICASDADCNGRKCIDDTNEYPCNVNYLKTIGFGGDASRVPTPEGAVGICNQEYSGCTEYIDPLSKHAENLIYNPGALDINKDGSININDSWIKDGNYYYQDVKVQPNKLYTLKLETKKTEDGSLQHIAFQGRVSVGAANTFYVLKADNKLYNQGEGFSTNDRGLHYSSYGSNESVIFYSGNNKTVRIFRDEDTVNAEGLFKTLDMDAILKEVIINYQINSNIDSTSCNGVVNTDNGCVLFNVRSQSGASGLKTNVFAADLTNEGSGPASCSGENTNYCNANQVIKASPDRVCSKWLSCQTYIEDPVTKEKVCYSMGECSQLNDKNECVEILPMDQTVRNSTLTSNKNATGYSLLNNYYIGAMKEVGQNTEAHFDFEDSSVNLSCVRNIDVSGALISEKDKACVFDKNINDSLVLNPKDATTDYPANGKGYLKVLGYYQISPISKDDSISIFSNQDYYINYLINTKGSGLRAKLIITDENNNVIATFADASPNGWERKINQFKVTSPITEIKKIRIYLSSNAVNTNTSYVYFDDINIEPVLKTSNNSYIAKSCRLYPSDDSLTCTSANNNVVKDGLYGYCLQSDPINPNVCLMWYPIDKISPITKNTQSSLGYSGKFPLYYCSEANGDFTLVEKRVGVLHSYAGMETTNPGEVIAKVGGSSGTGIFNNTVNCSNVIDSMTVTGGDCRCLGDSSSNSLCGSPDYVAITFRRTTGEGDFLAFNGPERTQFMVYCAPKKAGLKIETETKVVDLSQYHINANCRITFKEGWWNYNGLSKHNSVYYSAIDYDNDNFITETGKSVLADVNESSNTLATSFSSIMVMNINNPAEGNLKHVYNQNPEDVYRVTCNRFIQVVDNSGKNAAWTGRTSRNNMATNTPSYLGGAQGYIRNREDVPFGASILPNNFDFLNSEVIPLRNQYSKRMSESVLAGRPYSCTGPGCANIGQCSLDPNVFCFYRENDEDLNKLSCSAGGNGTCVKLWGDFIPSIMSATNYLNNIFAEKYVDYVYSSNTKTYQRDNNVTLFNKISSFAICDKRSDDSGLCKIYPIISNVKISGQGVSFTPKNKTIKIEKSGVYQLSFNTKVDEEQQPLRQIIINWGDGSQVITGVDHKPETSDPHTVSHFYLEGDYNDFNVSVFDNWGTYKNLFE